jgi:predicted membrane-bound mannosyltransferase
MSFDNALALLPVALIVASAALMAFSKPIDARGEMRPQFVFACACFSSQLARR